jgi:hypothetical protein
LSNTSQKDEHPFVARLSNIYKRRISKKQTTLKSPKTPKMNFYECPRVDNITPPGRDEDLYRAKIEYEQEMK